MAHADLPLSLPSPTVATRPSLTGILHEWVTTVDHKKIGIMYVLMAVFFLVVGGIEALLIRLQLFVPRGTILGPDRFNQLFTMHGTTMVFFMGMPILIGIGNYMVPLMIGARDMAFPRLNAMGFWVTLFGALIAYFSFLIPGGPPAIGWFAYAPLTSTVFARGAGTDFWAAGLLVAGVGTIGAAVNFIATIVCMRCPGMELRKIPFFAWTILWTSVQIVIAIPPLTAALIMLLLDRQLGARFFNPQSPGAPSDAAYLWQHLFWFFGHPEVYILILPAFGMISEVVPVFSRKVLFGYEFMALATMGIAFISLGVWAHHMFAVGMGRVLNSAFAITSLLVSIPTGIKFFNWLATMYGGRISFATPMLFACGFLSMFLIGGLTGIMLAAAPMDFQLTDTYFVVGHFHWVLIGGTVFGVFAGIYYWYPKATGRMLNETLGKVAVLAAADRLYPDLRPDAPFRHAGHAAAHRRVPHRPALALAQPVDHHRGPDPGAQFPAVRDQRTLVAEVRQTRRRQSVGSLDPGMGHAVAAAQLQLRGGPHRPQSPAVVGPDASG